MKKAIVTGANGYVGAALVKELVKNQVEVLAIVRNEHSNLQRLEGVEGLRVVTCPLEEITDLKNRIPDSDIDVFYHIAWDGSGGDARGDVDLQIKNIQFTADCVRSAKALHCGRIVSAGTISEADSHLACEIQGNQPRKVFSYGGAKSAAHCISRCLASDLGIDLVWGKIMNIYGPHDPTNNFVNTVIRKMAKGEPPEFTPAKQPYDFIYIDDVARAFYLLGEKGQGHHYYNVASGGSRPLREFISEIIQVVGNSVEPVFGAIPFTGDMLPASVFDNSHLVEDTGFRAEMEFKTGVQLTADWLLNWDKEHQ